MSKILTVIDLFCGAGGFSEGFRQAGFKVVAGLDIDKAAASTFKEAHPDAHFFQESIELLNPKEIRKSLKLKKGELSCMVGGPPCQAYSVNNHNRGFHDIRAKLFRSYIKFVSEFRPKWVVIENVTGILSAGEGKAVVEITKALKKLGYTLELKILKAEEYGVPQSRRRVFILGTRTSSRIEWPKPIYSENDFVSVSDAISDLPSIRNGGGTPEMSYRYEAKSNFQKQSRKKSLTLFNHETNLLKGLNLKRLKFVQQGGSWRDIPTRLLPAGMRRANKSDHTKRYGRLKMNGLSSTILTKCDIHWGCFIHPTQDRVISVREAARFQSFPDHYRFFGSRTDQYRQVGNAVPPLLALAVAQAIKKSLVKSFENQKITSKLGSRPVEC